MKNRTIIFVIMLLSIIANCGEIAAAGLQLPLTSGGAVQYVIITPLRYASIFQRLADWKTAKGVPAKVVTLEEIYREYSSRSADRCAQIREFLKDAFKAWNLKWVLLGGDTMDEDGMLIPVRYVRSDLHKNIDLPSDLYYANFDGSWDANGNGIFGEFKDNCDLTPEIHIGRASIDSREDASTFVDKVLAYEKNPAAASLKKALVVGFDLDENTKGELDAEMLVREYLKGFSIKRFYSSPKIDPQKIADTMSKFEPHFVYVGSHGNTDKFGTDYSKFTNIEADNLSNSFPFIFTSIACNTNYFDKDSLSEHFMNNPHGGAVAYWACSRYGYFNTGNERHFESILMIKDFFHLLFIDPKNHSYRLGEVVSRARAKYIPEASAKDDTFRWLILAMNLLGDPEMPLWTNTPQQMNIKSSADPGDNRISVRVLSNEKPVAKALVCIRYLDEKRLGITVSARNHIPEQAIIPNWGVSGLYNFGETDQNGQITFSGTGHKKVILAKIEELIRLDKAIRDLEIYLKTIRSNTKVHKKLVRDYQYLQVGLERNQKEIRDYCINLAKSRKFSEIEEILDVLRKKLQDNPEAVAQFRFSLKAITDKLRFDLTRMQQDSTGIQIRILNQLLELQKGISAVEKQQPGVKYGRISVTSEPSGATVLMNNVPRGQTPCVIDQVPFGTHSIKVQIQGFGVKEQSVRVNQTKTVKVRFALESFCSIRGKVVLKDKGIDRGIEINLRRRISSEHGIDKWEVIASTVADINGEFSFRNIQKTDVSVLFTRKGYNDYYKTYLFSRRDQNYHPVCNAALLRMVNIYGHDQNLKGGIVYLLMESIADYNVVEKKEVTGDSFRFEGLVTGSYQVVATKPGYGAPAFKCEIENGAPDIEAKLPLKPVSEVDLKFVSSGNEKLGIIPLKLDPDGIFRVKMQLKACESDYVFFFVVNPEDNTNNFYDPQMLSEKFEQTNRGNILKLKKSREITFEYDPKQVPVFTDSLADSE